MNIGAPWPALEEAESRVRGMQSKLHQWAVADPDRCFGDLYNLVYDPAFLAVGVEPGAEKQRRTDRRSGWNCSLFYRQRRRGSLSGAYSKS